MSWSSYQLNIFFTCILWSGSHSSFLHVLHLFLNKINVPLYCNLLFCFFCTIWVLTCKLFIQCKGFFLLYLDYIIPVLYLLIVKVFSILNYRRYLMKMALFVILWRIMLNLRLKRAFLLRIIKKIYYQDIRMLCLWVWIPAENTCMV